jgi:hypothetical protein
MDTIRSIKNMGIATLVMLLLMLFAYITSPAQTLDPPDSTTLTYSKVYDDMKQGITALSQSLKVGAEYVFTIMVRQQVVNSVMYVIVYIVLFGVCLLLLRWNLSHKKEMDKEENWLDGYKDGRGIALLIVSCFISVISFIVLFVTIGHTVMGFINPEYGALKEILEFVR